MIPLDQPPTDSERVFASALPGLAELILASVDDAVIVIDPQTFVIRYWNRAAAAMYGWTAAEAVGESLSELLRSQLLYGVTLADTQASIARLGVWRGEVRQQRRDGRQLLIDAAVRELRDDTGRLIGLVSINRDVTDRRAAQEALRASEANLRAFFDSSAAAHYLLDTEYRILAVNRVTREEVRKIWGREIEFGDSVLEYVNPPNRESFMAHYQRCLAGESVGYERRVTYPSGKVSWYEFSYTPVRTPDGSILGVAFSGLDITARKQAEADLRLRNRAIDATSSGIMIADTQLPGMPVLYVNPAVEQITGYSRDELIGRSCHGLQDASADPAVAATIERAVMAGQSCHVRAKKLRKDGSSYWNDMTLSPLCDEDGQVTHYIGVQVDVTATVELEAQLQQAQRLEGIGRLAGGIAHDFNNLLTVMGSAIEFARDALPPDHPALVDIDTVAHAAERAGLLTRQLLAFARRQPIHLRPTDLNDLIERMVPMLQRLIPEDIQLQVQLAPDLPPMQADVGQIEQVLLNLVVNARDAMPSGGVLTIATGRGQPEAGEGGPVTLAVSDTGVGIAPEDQHRVFEPFFTTKAVGHGTGLGLATCYGIVQQHGGQIGCESSPEYGTTFRVALPVAGSTTVVGEPSARSSQLPRGSETILLVEDEEAVRSLASRLLRAQGYTVIEAQDGVTALALMRERVGLAPQLLLTDVVMPHMGGPALAATLLSAHPELRVLFISGYSDRPLSSDDPLLHKPFSPHELARAVREVLDAPRAA